LTPNLLTLLQFYGSFNKSLAYNFGETQAEIWNLSSFVEFEQQQQKDSPLAIFGLIASVLLPIGFGQIVGRVTSAVASTIAKQGSYYASTAFARDFKQFSNALGYDGSRIASDLLPASLNPT
jgi:hypothetical protein